MAVSCHVSYVFDTYTQAKKKIEDEMAEKAPGAMKPLVSLLRRSGRNHGEVHLHGACGSAGAGEECH